MDSSIEDKFWSKVDKVGECWEWQGSMTSTGYGDFRANGVRMRAHRMSWTLYYGAKPKKFICHTCDNPKCVKPDHLFEGTAKDNSQDMVKKGRHSSTVKTHCPQNHGYTKNNTYIHKNGSRRCKKCHQVAYQKSVWKM